MDNSPVKKKKKYVKKVIQEENSESSEVGNAKSSTNASQLEKEPFGYSFDEIVNHILAKIIPDSRFVIDLTNGVIIGQTRQIEEIRKRMTDNIKCYTGFIIELENGIEREDIQYESEEPFDVCLFGSSILEKKIAETFVGTKFQEDFNSFLKMFKSDSTRLFVRMMRKYQQQFLKKIEKKIQPLHKVGISNKQAVRGNRENLKKQMASVTIDKQAFDSKKWKEFVSKSDKLKANDIEIIENKNQYGKTETYTIKLSCLERDSQIRLEGFNYYFKYQDFVSLPTKDSEHKTQIIKQYGKFQKNWLTITFLKGYKSSKWDDKTLIYKIRTDNISKKKTNFTNELFQGFHLIGLLPKVREYIEQLEYEINNVPLDDVKEQLFLQMSEEIRDALRSSKAVQKLIQDFLKDYAIQYSDICKVLSIKFIQRSVKLNILIAKGKEKKYDTTVKNDLETILTKEMQIKKDKLDFDIDQQFLGKLEEESIIVTSHKKNQFSYLSKSSDFHQNLEKIQAIKRELQEISQEELFVKGKAKLNKYMDQIKGLKNNSKYEDIYITQPQSLDKINYRIAFVGSRKNNAEFIALVNQRIAEIEKTLGTYYKLIDQQQTNFLVEDSEIQERILKNYNMSTVVDPTHTAEAILEIMPSQPSKKIYFFKSKNLSIVPINYKIFFIGAEQLELFSQKYLDILKMKSKRLMKNDIIKEVEPNRKLQLYYKKQMGTQELVFAALQDILNEHLACFILPKQQKQKFIKDLLTVLTYSKTFQQKKYSFIIINPYEEEDIKTIINLPEFQLNKKDELVIEWSCDGHPYAKSGNSKINDAISKGERFCILTEDDLSNLRHRVGSVFICDLQQKTLTKGTDRLPLLIEKDCIKFIFKDKIYQLSSKQYNQIKTYLTTTTGRFYMTLAHYSLDLRDETQTNIFSGRTRKLQKHQKLLQIQGDYNGKVHAYYEKCTPALIFSFEQAQSKKLSAAVTETLTYLADNIKTSIIKLKPVSERYRSEVAKMLKSKAEEYELRYQYNQTSNSVILQSLNEKNIIRCQRIIQSEMDYLLMLEKMQGSSQMVQEKREVKYPDDWRPQKDEIQTFVVSPFTQQFQNVQQLFTVKPIAELIKIQNKYLYKKYSDELDHLTYLNKNKRPKEMMLFHGTKYTDPRIIWEDKEEGFNINYSADSNLLGRGIYFAEKSEYSMGYMHPEPLSMGSMFLCKVIVGQSQQLKMTSANSQVKDTIIKDNNTGIRYESMKGKHDICDIYVVYKDKRAYPAYLIKFKI